MLAWAAPALADFPFQASVVEAPTRSFGDAAYETLEEIVWRLDERLQAEGSGVIAEPLYIGEVFSNTRGGISTKDATQFQALLDLPLTFDFREMLSPLPGRFFLLAQNTHGRGLTDDFVGDTQVLSNIDSFKNIARVSEFWWEVSTWDERLILRLGKQDVNTEFLFIDLADDFIQSTFGLSPSTAFPTYPDPSMGAVLLIEPNEKWRWKIGIWDAFSTGGNWGFSGNDTILLISELEYRYRLGGGALPGMLTVGAIYESAGEREGEFFSPVHEYVVQVEQWVYREAMPAGDRPQGLAVFAGYYPRFPGDSVPAESVGDSYVAGCSYRGLLPLRDHDEIGFGIAWTELFQGGTNQETAVELYYDMRVTPRLNLQPDLQYIATPSGIHRDSLVFGVRFELRM
ncbi:MAG: carbohydrate porin [Planctomycetota bacterium]